jgi:hypothetical protein
MGIELLAPYSSNSGSILLQETRSGSEEKRSVEPASLPYRYRLLSTRGALLRKESVGATCSIW